jgi:cytochrome c-type biogenesis protein CcmE
LTSRAYLALSACKAAQLLGKHDENFTASSKKSSKYQGKRKKFQQQKEKI